jgi:hypothetical protein
MPFTKNHDLERLFYMSQLGVTEGQINDLELQYLLQELSLTEGQVQDLWLKWFDTQGVFSGAINDRWYAFLIEEGYSGTVTDMINKYFWDKIEESLVSFLQDAIIIYGQSNSTGTECTPALSTTPSELNKMFNVGVRSGTGNSGAGNFDFGEITSLVALAESNSPKYPTVDEGETIGYSFCERLSQINAGHKLVVWANGQDAQAIGDLNKGKARYNDMLNAVEKYVELTDNETPKVRAINFIHGETDAAFARTDYKANMLQFYTDINSDIKSITGQIEDIIILCSQQRAYDMADPAGATDVQILQLALENPDKFVCVTPAYFFGGGGIHWKAPNNILLGELFAYAYDKVIVKQQAHDPFRITSAVIDGNDVIVTTNPPEGEIEVDFYNVKKRTDLGFYVESRTITGAVKENATQVRITCSVAPTSGLKVGYAWRNGTAGAAGQQHNLNSNKTGNIRDQSTRISSLGEPLYNWLCQCYVTL